MKMVLLIYVGFLIGSSQGLKLKSIKKKYLYRNATWSQSAVDNFHRIKELLKCEDHNKKCPEWAAEGECGNNPNYMRENCRKACQLCEDVSIDEGKAMLEILLYGARSLYKLGPDETRTNFLKSLLKRADEYHKNNDFEDPKLYFQNAAEVLRYLSEEARKEKDKPDVVLAYNTLFSKPNFDYEIKTSEQSNFKLRNGKTMPFLGFGTWQLSGEKCIDAVAAAIKYGYRHVDTAQGYNNEKEVGKAIKKSGVAREDIFLTTKLSRNNDFGKSNVRAAVMKQLEDLDTSYIDLYMLHSLHSDSTITLETWKELEDMYNEGLIKALGVSNAKMSDLEMLSRYTKIKPMYVQNKMSIYHRDGENPDGDDILEFCKKNGIVLMSYSLLNYWPFKISPLDDNWIKYLADRHDVQPAQILLRWAFQLGAGVLPKSSDPIRINRNMQMFDFTLGEEEMALINSLQHMVSSPWNKPVSQNALRIKDPDWKQSFSDIVKSGESLDPNALYMTVVNNLKHDIELFWIHPNGDKLPAGDVSASQSSKINTFHGHKFEIHGDGKVVKKVEMDKDNGKHIEVHLKTEL